MTTKATFFPQGDYYLILPRKVRNVATVVTIGYVIRNDSWRGGGITVRVMKVKVKDLSRFKSEAATAGFIPLEYKDAGENERTYVRMVTEEDGYSNSHSTLAKGVLFDDREDFFRSMVQEVNLFRKIRDEIPPTNPEILMELAATFPT